MSTSLRIQSRMRLRILLRNRNAKFGLIGRSRMVFLSQGRGEEMIGKSVWCALLVTVLPATTAVTPTRPDETMAGRVAESQGGPPNIVLILMDDLGWKDTSVTGSLYYRTPNIDKIARGGMIFNQAYSAAPLCSPSRGALLSGKTPARTALTNVGLLVDPYGG